MSPGAVSDNHRAAAPAEPLIELAQVDKTYHNGELAVQVLHDIDLRIHAGEFVAIMGASGSGKSTLMNIVGCLDRPTGGHYRFQGIDVATLDRDGLARLRREAFGFVFQSYNLIGTLSALANVEVPALYCGMPAAQRHTRARTLLAALGLQDRADHRPNQLSGGQQQRVSFARAMMNGGYIILADEPTGALDTRSGREVMDLLKQLWTQGHTVILITHEADVAAHARRRIDIRDGRILHDSGAVDHNSRATPAPAVWHSIGSHLGEIVEATRSAARALYANLFRTVLTLLGIVIGVAAVIAMLAVGDGARQQVLARINAMGTDLVIVRPGAPNQRGRGDIATLVPADATAIAGLPNVSAAVPENSGSITIRFGHNDTRTSATTTSADFPGARNWPVAEGSFFTADDVRTFAAVAVLGRTVAQGLFGTQDPLGLYVIIDNILFQVIGVMEARGATPWGRDQDDVVFVPLSTGSLRLFGQQHLSNITVEVDDTSQLDATIAAIDALLMARHGVLDFSIRNMASLVEAEAEAQETLTLLLGSIAAISLLVGGIGVMNIMLVSVTERTREIGIRMATGARTRNILQQFLIESLVVSALGGGIGVVLGLGVVLLLRQLEIQVLFSAGPVLLAFGCAFATGLLFGWLPARKAARLDPVVALASE